MNEATLKLRGDLFSMGALSVALVGSTYIVGEGKDIDLLAFAEDRDAIETALQVRGYVREGGESYNPQEDEFVSMRKDEFNVILTSDREFFASWVQAAEVCKYLKLADKEQRVMVHRIIVDGWSAEGY